MTAQAGDLASIQPCVTLWSGTLPITKLVFEDVRDIEKQTVSLSSSSSAILRDEVKYVHSDADLLAMEKTARGKKDIVLGYVSSLGTQGMEDIIDIERLCCRKREKRCVEVRDDGSLEIIETY